MRKRVIYTLQVASIANIWVFVLAVNWWILSLLRVSHELNDALNASVAIGLVAVPLFFLIASVLTYVFVGLQRHGNGAGKRGTEDPGS